MIELIRKEFLQASTVFNDFTTDENYAHIESVAKIMTNAIKYGNKIISIGNGGSFSDAQHFASELSGKYRSVRKAYPAIALTDGGAMSCIANDFGYAQVFKRQLEAIGKDGDVLLCLSTSGNSENICVAAEYAKRVGIKVVGITGKGGGKLKEFCDVVIEIPHSGYADRVQEITIIVIHVLVSLIEKS